MKKFLACAFTLALSSAYATGIRYLDYHPDRIPNIVTASGIASEIIFEEDEKIVYYTFGFDAAWDSTIARDHILIFKAKDEQPQTNLLIHTDKRNYVFTLTSGNDNWKQHPKNSGADYSVRIRYHDDKSQAALQGRSEEREIRNSDISSESYLYSNYDYRATAYAQDLIPSRMWDNGSITFIQFAPSSKRGVVYERKSNGKTALVNQHTEKNGLLVVHGVYARLLIRLGEEAVEIRRNEIGGLKENLTKTSIPNVVRTIAGDAPTQFKVAPQAPTLFLAKPQTQSDAQDVSIEIIEPQ